MPSLPAGATSRRKHNQLFSHGPNLPLCTEINHDSTLLLQTCSHTQHTHHTEAIIYTPMHTYNTNPQGKKILYLDLHELRWELLKWVYYLVWLLYSCSSRFAVRLFFFCMGKKKYGRPKAFLLSCTVQWKAFLITLWRELKAVSDPLCHYLEKWFSVKCKK